MRIPPGSALPAACLALILPAVAAAAEVDHPAYLSWARYKVGTEITIRSLLDQKGQKVHMDIRTRLIDKDATRVVIEETKTTDVSGEKVEQAPSRFTIYRKFPLIAGVKPEDVGKPPGASTKGEETIEVDGKPYKTVWFDSRARTEAGAANIRTWMSDEVPGRLVKVRSEVPSTKRLLTQELVEIRVPE